MSDGIMSDSHDFSGPIKEFMDKNAQVDTPAPAPEPVAAVAAPAAPMRFGPDQFSALELPAADGPLAGAPDPEPPAGIPDPPEIAKDPKAHSAWTVLKRTNKTLEQQITQLKSEVEQAKKNPEIETLRQQVTAAEERIGKLDLTQSRAFQEQYVAPARAVASRAVQMVMRATGRSQEEATDLVKQATAPGLSQEQLQDLMGGEPPSVQGVLLQTSVELGEIVQRRDAALSDWRATHDKLQVDSERTVTATQMKKIAESTAEAAEALAAQEGSWLFDKHDTDSNWNDQRDRLVSAARAVLRDGKPEELAKYVLEGVAAAVYRKFGTDAFNKYAELRNSVERSNARRPRLGGREEPLGQAPTETKGPRSHEAFLREAMPNANL